MLVLDRGGKGTLGRRRYWWYRKSHIINSKASGVWPHRVHSYFRVFGKQPRPQPVQYSRKSADKLWPYIIFVTIVTSKYITNFSGRPAGRGFVHVFAVRRRIFTRT